MLETFLYCPALFHVGFVNTQRLGLCYEPSSFSLLISESLCSASLSLDSTYLCLFVPGDRRKYLLNCSIFLSFVKILFCAVCSAAIVLIGSSVVPAGTVVGDFPSLFFCFNPHMPVSSFTVIWTEVTFKSHASIDNLMKTEPVLSHSCELPPSEAAFGPCLSSPRCETSFKSNMLLDFSQEFRLQWGGLAPRR